jgi:hypothetical protein
LKTYFISGHRNVTPEEFEKHYAGRIREAVKSGAVFVVGDYYGVDTMAQQLLKDLDAEHVTVYHMFDLPRNNVGCFPMSGGFTSDVARDEAMTRISDEDILWVRPEVKQDVCGKLSGTEENEIRRQKCITKSSE